MSFKIRPKGDNSDQYRFSARSSTFSRPLAQESLREFISLLHSRRVYVSHEHGFRHTKYKTAVEATDNTTIQNFLLRVANALLFAPSSVACKEFAAKYEQYMPEGFLEKWQKKRMGEAVGVQTQSAPLLILTQQRLAFLEERFPQECRLVEGMIPVVELELAKIRTAEEELRDAGDELVEAMAELNLKRTKVEFRCEKNADADFASALAECNTQFAKAESCFRRLQGSARSLLRSRSLMLPAKRIRNLALERSALLSKIRSSTLVMRRIPDRKQVKTCLKIGFWSECEVSFTPDSAEDVVELRLRPCGGTAQQDYGSSLVTESGLWYRKGVEKLRLHDGELRVD